MTAWSVSVAAPSWVGSSFVDMAFWDRKAGPDVSSTGAFLSIDINDATGTQDNGDGVGLDSNYEFGNVFQITNLGTQEIEVSISELSGDDFDPNANGLTVQFYPGSSVGSPLHSNPVTLTTGESVNVGLNVVTGDPNVDDFSADATVSADAT